MTEPILLCYFAARGTLRQSKLFGIEGINKMVAVYQCAVCGEEIETEVDESQGLNQEYIEDCQVCCRPNVLRVVIDEDRGTASIESAFEE